MSRLSDTISATPGLDRETREALIEGLHTILETDLMDTVTKMMDAGTDIIDSSKKMVLNGVDPEDPMGDEAEEEEDEEGEQETENPSQNIVTEGILGWLFGKSKDPAAKLSDQAERIFDDLQTYLESIAMRSEKAALSGRGYGYAGGNVLGQMSSKIEQARSKMLNAIGKIRSSYNSAIKQRDKAYRVRDSYDNKLNYMRDSRDDYRNRYNEVRKSRRR